MGKSDPTDQFAQESSVEKYDPAMEESFRKQAECSEILDTTATTVHSNTGFAYEEGPRFALVYCIIAQSTWTGGNSQDPSKQISWFRDIEDNSQCLWLAITVIWKMSEQLAWNRARIKHDSDVTAFLESSAKSKIDVNEIFYDLFRQRNRNTPAEKTSKKSRDSSQQRL